MSEYYNRKGEPLELMEWGKLFEDRKYKILKQETLPSGKFISTVWLGMDHNFGGGEPLIFETMVFPTKANYMEEICERYSTEEEALLGHERIKKQLEL